MKYLKFGPWVLFAVAVFWGYSQHRAADKARGQAAACEQAVKDGVAEAKILKAQVETKAAEIAGLSRDLLKARIAKDRPAALVDSPESIPLSEGFARECQTCLETLPVVEDQNGKLWASNKLLTLNGATLERSKRKWRTTALILGGAFATLATVDILRR